MRSLSLFVFVLHFLVNDQVRTSRLINTQKSAVNIWDSGDPGYWDSGDRDSGEIRMTVIGDRSKCVVLKL